LILALIERSQIIPVGGGGPASEATVKVVPCNDADNLVGALWQLSATLTLGPEPAIVNNLDP
jgi:hypothetical protein